MLRMISSHEASAPRADVQGMIDGGKVYTTRTWVETEALLVTEVLGEPFGRYYMIVVTDQADEDDEIELNRLADELGKNLPDCVVERMRVDSPHPWYPGSSYFYLVTLYGG